MSTTWLDKLHVATTATTVCSYQIECVANAMHTLGLNEGAVALYEVAEELRKAAADIRGATSDCVNERVRQSEEATGNMVRAALACAARE